MIINSTDKKTCFSNSFRNNHYKHKTRNTKYKDAWRDTGILLVLFFFFFNLFTCINIIAYPLMTNALDIQKQNKVNKVYLCTKFRGIKAIRSKCCSRKHSHQLHWRLQGPWNVSWPYKKGFIWKRQFHVTVKIVESCCNRTWNCRSEPCSLIGGSSKN